MGRFQHDWLISLVAYLMMQRFLSAIPSCFFAAQKHLQLDYMKQFSLS